MKGTDKVIQIDFRKGKRSTPRIAFLAGPRLVAAVMIFVLVALIVLAAVLEPSWISMPFFGLTVVLVAVMAALATRWLALRLAARKMLRERLGHAPPPFAPEADTSRDDPRGRTLH